MSERARSVVRAIDDALTARDHHPTLFAAQLRAGRSCLQFARAVERYRRERKPAASSRTDHDDVERVDGAWEEQHARRREERFEKRRRDFAADARGRRATMTVLELVREALERATTISTVASGNVEPSRGGSDPAGPPRQQTMNDDPRWRETWAVIHSRALRALELLDEAEGLGTVAATTKMLGVEKDRLVLREEGFSPIAVVEKLGRDIAGSPETVRRIRRKAGRRASDGTVAKVDS